MNENGHFKYKSQVVKTYLAQTKKCLDEIFLQFILRTVPFVFLKRIKEVYVLEINCMLSFLMSAIIKEMF